MRLINQVLSSKHFSRAAPVLAKDNRKPIWCHNSAKINGPTPTLLNPPSVSTVNWARFPLR